MQGSTQLPTVEKVEEYTHENIDNPEENDKVAKAWFSNGAAIAYRETPDGEVYEETYKADDPESMWEHANVGSVEHHSAAEALVMALDEYNWYVENDAADELWDDWTAIGEVLAE